MEDEVTELRKQEVDGDCEASGHAPAHVQRASYLNTHDNTLTAQKQEQMAMLLLNGDKT